MNRYIPIAALLLFVILVASAQVLAKLRLDHFGPIPLNRGLAQYAWVLARDPGMLASVTFTVMAAACYYVGLSRMPLNNAIFLTALVYPAVAIGSWCFLGERAGLAQIAGMAMVGLGVVAIVAG